MTAQSVADFYQSMFADVARAGVYRMPRGDLAGLIEGASAVGCCVFRVELAQAGTKSELFHAMGKSLAFPEWFGHNWDALTDSLLDMGWRPAIGYLVVLDHCDDLRIGANADFSILLEILREVTDQWRADGVHFWCLIDNQGDDLPELPTNCQAA